VPLVEPDDYALDLRCAPFTVPGAPEQTVDVTVNGKPVASLRLPPGLTEQHVVIPASVLRANLNRLAFRYGYVRSPTSVGLGEDSRELGVQCDWIKLTR